MSKPDGQPGAGEPNQGQDAAGGSGDDQNQSAASGGDGGGDAGSESLTLEQAQAALAAARREAAGYRHRLRDTEKERDDLKTEAQSEHEKAVADAVKAREVELAKEHRGELLALKIEARAGAKLADPADAARFVDPAQFADVDDAGLPKAIDDALEALMKEKPYLAAKAATPTPGGGLRRGSPGTRSAPAAKSGDPDDWLRRAAKR